MDERRLERALREGPPFATTYGPTLVALDERWGAPSRTATMRLVLLVAVTALLLIGMIAGLAALGMLRDEDASSQNGWVAFAVWDGDTSQQLVDRDIYVVGNGQPAHRIIGSDSDTLDQICPAFSPDGRRLAYGQANGVADDFGVGPDGETVRHEGTYRDAALVIVDLDADANPLAAQTIEVGGDYPPPCATWSSDGQNLAFGVSLTSWNNPQRSEIGSEVWVVTLEGLAIDVVSDVFASDLAWSPVDAELAIASHQAGQPLSNGAISLYSAYTGDTRTLVGPSAVSKLSWSPDGTRIVSQRGENVEWTSGPRPVGGMSLWVTEVDRSGEYLLSTGFHVDHGIGPEWSPTGEWIVYQPICDESPTRPGAPCREESDVVLVPADGGFERRDPGDGEVVMPHLTLAGEDGSVPHSPYRLTWSPDGTQLLYLTFGGPTLIAVPIDASSPPVVLYDNHDGSDISVYEGDGILPTQTWARRPAEQPVPSRRAEPALSEAPFYDVLVHDGPLEAGTYKAESIGASAGHVESLASVRFTVPAGWTWNGSYLSKGGIDAPDGAAIFFFADDDELLVYDDPCHWMGAEPGSRPGNNVQDFVDALAAQSMRNATTPSLRYAAVPTVREKIPGRWPGMAIELTVPDDIDFAECDGGEFRSWGPDPDARSHQGPGQRDLVWVVTHLGEDVQMEGARMIIDAATFPGTPAEVIAEIEAILDSLAVGHWG